MQTKKVAALIAALALAGATAPAAALAGPPEPGAKGKCNSGRGNGSEPDRASDCDPGNSGGHNNGGD
jgi:hypothetical protein